jgi:type II secretory pathway pseudopilin PulG
MKTRKYSGFGIVELLVAGAVVAVVATAGAIAYSSLRTSQREAKTGTGISTYASVQQDAVAAGVDPGRQDVLASVTRAPGAGISLGVATSKVVVSSTVGRTAVIGTTVGVENSGARGANSGYSLGFGGGVSLQVDPVLVGLLPPAWPPSLAQIAASNFSLNVDLLVPDNPAGTVYRYTTDGSDPTSESPVWAPATFQGPDDLPGCLKAAAFNGSGNYQPSPVAVVYPKVVLEVFYARERGGVSQSFTYGDLTGQDVLSMSGADRNGIVLAGSPNVPLGNYVLRYTTDGSQPTLSSPVYPGPFVIPATDAGWFSAGSIQLRAGAFSTNPKYLNSSVGSYALAPVAVKLDMPVFSPAPDAGVRNAGDVVTLSLNSVNAQSSNVINKGGSVTQDTASTVKLW